MDVGKRLKELREKRGITVNKLADLAGLSQSFLREIELGDKKPTVETLSYFCDALGVSLGQFFSENEVSIEPALLTALQGLSSSQQLMLADLLASLNNIVSNIHCLCPQKILDNREKQWYNRPIIKCSDEEK